MELSMKRTGSVCLRVEIEIVDVSNAEIRIVATMAQPCNGAVEDKI
jgi:hypothetical protein